ncbi:hypothetical protein [Cellulosimicrobium sp. ES-005]|uniref:Uncharacterized protein n=1 Tax=Cellulosimicrobium sp. ES-005 TaxID=3163031 RepID=A0AAU8FVA3_9MICO
MEERDVDDRPWPARPRGPRPPVWVGTAAVVVGALVVVVALVSRLSGGGRDCPAIAYPSLLEVVLTGETADVAHVQLSNGDGEPWYPPLPTDPGTAEPALSPGREGDTWTFTFSSPRNPIGLRALDAAGVVVAETKKSVEMVRTGGSEACGGPMQGRIGWAL